MLLYGLPFHWIPQNSAGARWPFFCHTTNGSSRCLWCCSKQQSHVVKKLLIFVIIWIVGQNETACHIAWESYKWSWVGLQGLNDKELGRFLFYHCFSIASRELWMRSYRLTVPANHAMCDIHCLPGTTNNRTLKPFVRTLFCDSLTFPIWVDVSALWQLQRGERSQPTGGAVLTIACLFCPFS